MKHNTNITQISNQHGNPEPAKALSWVVDKTMQDLFEVNFNQF